MDRLGGHMKQPLLRSLTAKHALDFELFEFRNLVLGI